MMALPGCDCPVCEKDRMMYGGYEVSRLQYENKYLRERNELLMREINNYRYGYFPSALQVPVPNYYSTYSGFTLDGPKQNMGNKLSVLAKKVLDKNLRTLVKAGVLDESLEVTEEGVNFLLSDYLSENKERLAKEASEKIKEEEK